MGGWLAGWLCLGWAGLMIMMMTQLVMVMVALILALLLLLILLVHTGRHVGTRLLYSTHARSNCMCVRVWGGVTLPMALSGHYRAWIVNSERLAFMISRWFTYEYVKPRVLAIIDTNEKHFDNPTVTSWAPEKLEMWRRQLNVCKKLLWNVLCMVVVAGWQTVSASYTGMHGVGARSWSWSDLISFKKKVFFGSVFDYNTYSGRLFVRNPPPRSFDFNILCAFKKK